MAVDRLLAERAANGESIAVRDQAIWRGILATGALLTLSLLAATLIATTAPFFWAGDLAVHFRVQYAGLALVGFILLLIARAPAWAALALAVAAVNAMSASPWLITRPVSLPPSEGEPLRVRVASINVLYANNNFGEVAEFIRRERPDAVTLVEMNPEWRRGLAELARDYPHRYDTQGRRGRGVTFLSRHPMKDVSVLPIGAAVEPAIRATLQVHGRELHVFSIHTAWPMWPGSAGRRNEQLSRLAGFASGVGGPLVVIGDLNVSPYSPHFEALLSAGKLRSAASGFGWQPTWPAFMPPAGIQIDHALVNAGVTVERFRRGPPNGSDHTPILADLVL